MSTVLAILGSPAISNLLVTAIGAILTYIFGKIGTNILSDQKKKVARDIVMAAVSQLAETAKTFKTSSDSGKLTPEQIQTLTNNAVTNAQEIGKRLGIDVAKTLGPEGAELAVKLAVKSLKSLAQKKTPNLPADVKEILP